MKLENNLPFQTQNHEVLQKHWPHGPLGTTCLQLLSSDQEALFCTELLSELSESHDLSQTQVPDIFCLLFFSQV